MKLQSAIRNLALLNMVFLIGVSVSSPAQKKNGTESLHGAKFQPLNVKPGLWESTNIWKTSGELPIPAGMLERLSPEQRARLEQRMKARSEANSHTDTNQHCVTKEELQNPKEFGDNRCTWTILESTSTSAKGNVSCEAEGMKMVGNGEFQAPDPEHMTGWEHVTSSGGGRTMKVDGTFTSKWLSSSCGNGK
jgi:hypothetical protein